MVRRALRSRSLRRIPTKLPGNTVKVQYKYKKPQKAHCAACGADLKGVPRERPFKMQRMAKTLKRPERPYGGVLCSKCTRKLMLQKASAVGVEQ